MSYVEVINGPIEAILWLAKLEVPGPLYGCIVCKSSTIYVHPVHGGLHPRCVPRAMVILEADDGGGVPVRPVAGSARRGAYARRKSA